MLVQAMGAQTQSIAALAQAVSAQTNLLSSQFIDHESRIRVVERDTIQLKERMPVWQIAQASWTSIAAAVAALLGRGS